MRPKSLNWGQDRCSTILRDLLIGAVEWECSVTCDSRTARQEARSLRHWPVMRVFKESKQLPFQKRPFAVPLCQILSQDGSQEPRSLDICMISNRFSWIRLYLETNRLSTRWLARPIWSSDICHRMTYFDCMVQGEWCTCRGFKFVWLSRSLRRSALPKLLGRWITLDCI